MMALPPAPTLTEPCAHVPNRPPELSPASRLFVRMAERTTRLSRARIWTIIVAATLLTGIVDVATGQLSLGPAYMLIVFFAGWSLRGASGLAATALTVVMANTVSHFTLHGPDGIPIAPAAEVWNVAARFLSGAMVALLVGGLRSALELERWRAAIDGLTGVLNKAAFHARRTALVDRARRDGQAIVLAYMDLDGFKQVNDRHGHSAGDRVLTAFAQGAGAAIRSSDLFARIGGDEFVALLAVPDCERGDTVAELLHRRLSGVLRDTGFPVTCSMGALVTPAGSIGEADDLIALADRLMYAVKRSGKDALRIAPGDLAGDALRAAFPPPAETGFAQLLKRIDRADRAARAAA